MKRNVIQTLFICLFLAFGSNSVYASEQELPKGLKGLSIGGVWYLSFQHQENSGDSVFKVKRSYINIKKKFTKWFSGRITPDAHQDSVGDLKVRLKYAYGKFHFPDLFFLTSPALEVGQVHGPWLDFEEHINYYRLQDTMFIEKNSTFNSADFGLTFFALLGGEMDKEYQQRVSKKYPGRYGSFAVGVYNGGGYHAKEMNKNKVVEGRLTIRPLPDFFPGLQLSYFGVFGKGNDKAEPDWTVHMGFLSYEHQYLALTGTYYTGKGNQKGTAVDKSTGEAQDRSGYSVFGEVKIPQIHCSLIGRYDYFDYDSQIENDEVSRVIGGIAYHLTDHHKILLDYDRAFYKSSKQNESRLQLTLEIHF